MQEFIKHFKQNKHGKDYVVGDIHGTFKNLYKILMSIGFDFDKDRLFSVGDLCDRGPDSIDILQWMEYPWFFPVMGNHEEIILKYELGIYDENDLKTVGASWWIDLPQESKKIIVKKYRNLPVGIEVETRDGLVGIIHAECPHYDWNQLNKLLNSMSGLKFLNQCLWSNMSPLQEDEIMGVKAVIVGHMVQKKPCIKGNVHLIDTGSGFRGGYLTIKELETLKIVSK